MDKITNNFEEARKILKRVSLSSGERATKLSPDKRPAVRPEVAQGAQPLTAKELSGRYADDIAALRRVREDLKRAREGSK